MTEVQVGQREYLSCAETAKLVRGALKRAFPGQKFSVRSDTYSMGASIHVRWTDGPTESAVYEVVDAYGGAGFDGMIDLKFSYQHWLEDDGSVTLAYTPGTEGSRGVYPERIGSPRTPGARLVHFGADYVFTNRDLSEGFLAEVAAGLDRKLGSGQCRKCYARIADGEYGYVVTSLFRGHAHDVGACQRCAAEIHASSVSA